MDARVPIFKMFHPS